MKLPVLSVDADIDEILWPNRLLLNFVGLWSPDTHDGHFVQAFAYFRLCFTIFIAFFTVIPQCFTIYKYWGDINILTEIGCIMLAMMLMIFKFVYVLIRHRDFRCVYAMMSDLWSLVRNQEERNAIVQFANQSKLCTLVFFYSGLADFVTFTCASVLICVHNYVRANGTGYHRSLPLDLWYGIDTQPSPYFELLFVAQALGLCFTATSVIGCDSTMMAVIMHLVGQFRLISLRLQDIGRKIEGAILDSNPKNKLRFEMGLCIQHHQRMLRLFQYVDELLNPIIFGQLILAAVEICLSGFAIIEGDNNGFNLVKFSFFLVSMFVQLVIWCWPGELAIRESKAIADVVFYKIPWLTLTSSEQRNLLLIIYRAQKPCQITALGIQVMCLRKLSEVFNTAISYMALLRSMKEKRTL